MTFPADVLNVSLSAINSYRQCQQQYAYRYFERLRRKDRAKQLELGSMLHKYLELYYGQYVGVKKRAPKPLKAHQFAQTAASAEFAPSIKATVRLLVNLGNRELAAEFNNMLALAGRITDRYFATRGESDVDEYEILLVEEWLNLDLLRAGKGLPATRSNGKLDMLTRHRDNGRINLWENKSGAEIPESQMRLRDLQTSLYNEKLFATGKIAERVDAVIWNYLRTKEPTIPQQLKNGSLTTRADLDSTWEAYAAELTRLKLDFAQYEEQRTRLQGREESAFFPRFEQVILADPDVLLTDYVQTARDIRRSRAAWRAKKRRPVRTLSQSCNWCEYHDLCNAALLAGSDRDARSRFEVYT